MNVLASQNIVNWKAYLCKFFDFQTQAYSSKNKIKSEKVSDLINVQVIKSD